MGEKAHDPFHFNEGFKGAVGYLFEDNLGMLKTFAHTGAYSGDMLEDGILRVFRHFETPETA